MGTPRHAVHRTEAYGTRPSGFHKRDCYVFPKTSKTRTGHMHPAIVIYATDCARRLRAIPRIMRRNHLYSPRFQPDSTPQKRLSPVGVRNRELQKPQTDTHPRWLKPPHNNASTEYSVQEWDTNVLGVVLSRITENRRIHAIALR